MTSSMKWTAPSVLIGFTAALIWFGAPVVPAAIGAVAAGLILYLRAGRGS
jgi:hypothetical protein